MLRLTFKLIAFAIKTTFGLTGVLTGLLLRGGLALGSGGREVVRGLGSLGATIRCPRGCKPQAADGWWDCPSCSGRFAGWVWDSCPGCGARPGHVPCESCGHLIPNPHLH